MFDVPKKFNENSLNGYEDIREIYLTCGTLKVHCIIKNVICPGARHRFIAPLLLTPGAGYN